MRKRPAQPGLRRILPDIVPDAEEWRLQGACRGHHNPDPLWCPSEPRVAGAGVAICNTCPVKIRCGEYAMERREKHGTWGGITEWEREYLLTGRYRRPPKTPKE